MSQGGTNTPQLEALGATVYREIFERTKAPAH